MNQLRQARPKNTLSAVLVFTLWLTLGFFGALALVVYGSDPSWWSSRGAVLSPQISYTNGAFATNYAPNNYGVVTQGQLKQFTSKAVAEMNANLTNGAGTGLNSLVTGWQQDYATNGYSAANPKPSDYTVMNVGQLKYVGNQVWSQLVVGGYTNAVPSWLAVNANTDDVAATLGQLKEIFNFTLNSNVAAAPAFSPGGGSYTGAQTVTLTSATAGATIYYTIDGSLPTTSSSSVASGGTITVSATETVKAIAVVSGYQAQYAAFGDQTQSVGSTLDRQKSNSKDTDPTNLVDEGFRYRDLETGMFITRDPAGFVDGPNLYTYVVQNPWTSFDPEGLKEEPFDPKKDAPRNVHAGTETPLMVPATLTIGGLGSTTTMVPNPQASNCHSHAWDHDKGDPSNPKNTDAPGPKWDNDPASKMATSKNLKPDDPNKPGDVVVYEHKPAKGEKLPPGTEIDPKTGEVIDHSAIVTQTDKQGNTTRVESKEGAGPIVDHHPDDQNKAYGNDKQWYRPPPSPPPAPSAKTTAPTPAPTTPPSKSP